MIFRFVSAALVILRIWPPPSVRVLVYAIDDSLLRLENEELVFWNSSFDPDTCSLTFISSAAGYSQSSYYISGSGYALFSSSDVGSNWDEASLSFFRVLIEFGWNCQDGV